MKTSKRIKKYLRTYPKGKAKFVMEIDLTDTPKSDHQTIIEKLKQTMDITLHYREVHIIEEV